MDNQENHGLLLTEQEAHCIARLLQSALYGGEANILAGCTFCRYPCRTEGKRCSNFNMIRDKLTQTTGVDVTPMLYGDLPHSDFPYKKFLKNANQEAKEYFRNFFDTV